MKPTYSFLLLIIIISACSSPQKKVDPNLLYHEEYRNQVHFSPKQKWMNDPNGMVYYKGTYHLFYQYYPDSTVWGPMHWGHATSTNLLQWTEQPIALYPDSLGYIFSGSIVVDKDNTSGLGTNGQVPLVAIFTHHNMDGEKAGRSDFQYQSLAFSVDDGKTWQKYDGNPVLKNPGIKDFRDPKVMWYAPQNKWIMTLATKDRITFYSSKNLKEWTKESEFGQDIGAHGGVWECPDLFMLESEGKPIWVLLVSINPGGPNGGSATQYFTGTFDGKTFTPYQTDTRWLDHGTDNYAGVTWSNTGNRKIFMGWMSNWQYAREVPTKDWRSAMTVPRELRIEKIGDQYFVAAKPVEELNNLQQDGYSGELINKEKIDIADRAGDVNTPYTITFNIDRVETVTVNLSNKDGDKLIAGYDKKTNQYFIDRSKSGRVNFEPGFAKRMVAPRLSNFKEIKLQFIVDDASIEMFADDGQTTMTAIYFSTKPLTNLVVETPTGATVQTLQFNKLNSIWP